LRLGPGTILKDSTHPLLLGGGIAGAKSRRNNRSSGQGLTENGRGLPLAVPVIIRRCPRRDSNARPGTEGGPAHGRIAYPDYTVSGYICKSYFRMGQNGTPLVPCFTTTSFLPVRLSGGHPGLTSQALPEVPGTFLPAKKSRTTAGMVQNWLTLSASPNLPGSSPPFVPPLPLACGQGRGGIEEGFCGGRRSRPPQNPNFSPSPRPPPKASGRGEGAGGGVRARRNFNARKKCQHISPEN